METVNFDQYSIIPRIESLIQFIGVGKAKNAVASWRKACTSSRRLAKGFYYEQTFPWWRGLHEYWDAMGERGLNLAKLTRHTVVVAKDAQVVQTVIETMPPALKARFAANLGSRENAPAALCEIAVAHQFLTLEYALTWCEGDGSPMPEFLATKGELSFEVECKQISFDTGRNVSRAEFCHLADQIESALRRMQRMGRVAITLHERLTNKPQEHKRIANDIAKLTGTAPCGEGNFDWGTVNLQLHQYDQQAVDFVGLERNERHRKPFDAQMLIAADNLGGKPVHPLILSVQCRHADNVLQAAFSTLREAARRQLSKDRAGILCLFLPEISDYTDLADASDLRKMVDDFFDSKNRSHVAAIVFSSNDRVVALPDGFHFDKPVLAYRNGNCRFQEAKGFSYLQNLPE